MTGLDALMVLQEHDLAIDRMRHRRNTLPERAVVAAAKEAIAGLAARAAVTRAERDEIAREERRHEDEAQGYSDQAAAAERRLYSGEIASPRELRALQTDVESLRRHQRQVEERAIGAMERREPLEAALAGLDAELVVSRATETDAAERLRAADAVIADELAAEDAARSATAAGIAADLLADYEQCRSRARGVGAARLVGTTCQGCHLSIPATEADRIRRGPVGLLAHCDNCGCILVA